MNPKYQKVCAEIAKTEKKVEDLQGQLKELYDKKTELENLRQHRPCDGHGQGSDHVLPCRDEGQQGGKAYHYPAGGDGQ